MGTFYRILAQLTTKAAKWAWANKVKIMDMILKGLTVEYIVNYINSKI